MALNLGQEAIEACLGLRTNPDFDRLRAALAQTASDKIYASLQSEPTLRVEATAYARALSDLSLAIEAATTGVSSRQAKRPTLKGS